MHSIELGKNVQKIFLNLNSQGHTYKIKTFLLIVPILLVCCDRCLYEGDNLLMMVDVYVNRVSDLFRGGLTMLQLHYDEYNLKITFPNNKRLVSTSLWSKLTLQEMKVMTDRLSFCFVYFVLFVVLGLEPTPHIC